MRLRLCPGWGLASCPVNPPAAQLEAREAKSGLVPSADAAFLQAPGGWAGGIGLDLGL